MYVSEWQSRIDEIYPNKGVSPDYMMVHFSTKCSELARIFLHHKAHFLTTDPYVLKAMSWLLAISNHFGISFERCLIDRFPGKCSYCLERPCQCLTTGKIALDARTKRPFTTEEVDSELGFLRGGYRNSGHRLNFNTFQRTIFDIYPSNKAFIHANFWAFPLGKLDEEKGELHKAYSLFLLGKSTKEDIAIELADVAAWLISFWDYQNKGKNIDAELSSYYRNNCPICRLAPCKCPRYSISKGEEELLREVIIHVRALRTSGIEDMLILSELSTIAQRARGIDNQSDRDQLLCDLQSLPARLRLNSNLTPSVSTTIDDLERAVSALQDLFW